MTGFADWVPQAFLVCSQYVSKPNHPPVTPDVVLRWMIALWLSAPEDRDYREQSTEQQVAMAMTLAKRHGGKIVKPGE